MRWPVAAHYRATRNPGFDGARVCVHIRNINVARQEQRGHALLGGLVARRNQVFVVLGCGNCSLHVSLFQRFAQKVAPVEKMS